MAYSMKRHDRRPYLEAQIFRQDGVTPLDLSGAEDVFIIVSPADVGPEDSPKFRAVCVVTNAAQGQFEYRWAASDTDTQGNFIYEFEIVWDSGTGDVQTVPVDGYFDLVIYDDLDTP